MAKFNFYLRAEKMSLNIYGKQLANEEAADSFLIENCIKHNAKGVYVQAPETQKPTIKGRINNKKTAKQG